MKAFVINCLAPAAIFSLTPAWCAGQSTNDPVQETRPKIGLALSGGGARGAAHIGVIRELERLRIPIDYIAGTSMGAIVGGLYASGLSPDEMEKVLVEIDWDEIFRDPPNRKHLSRRRKFDDGVFQINKSFGVGTKGLKGATGFVQGRRLELLLIRVTEPVRQIEHFDDLPIPFRALATDIVTGEEVVLEQGNLPAAIRASMSVPGLLARVEIDGRLLVDGGIANNLPIDVVRRLGADVVIAVDISTPLQGRDELGSAFAITSQLSGFLTRQNTEKQIATLTDKDVFILPKLGDIATASFTRAAEAVAIGQAAAVAAADSLRRYALTETQYASHVVNRDQADRTPPIIDFVRIDNRSRIADEVIRSRLHIETGKPLDVAQLEQDLGELFGLGIFESVRYDLATEQGQTGVVVTVLEKPWGPRYLQFGANFSSDLGSDQELGLVFGLTMTPINRLGGEWRNLLRLGQEQGIVTELYQPLAVDSPYFVQPRLFFLNQRFNEFEDDQIIAENRVRRFGGEFAVGRELGTWGRLSLGVTRSVGDTEAKVGSSDASADFDEGLFSMGFDLDTLDDVNFPTSGARGSVRWDGSRTTLGADTRFDQLRVDAVGAYTWGRHTLLLGGRYFSTVDGEAPFQSLFRTGGLFELPGFAENELTGQHVVLLRSGYQRALGRTFGFPGYLGLTLQLGNVFEDEDDIDADNALVAASAYLGLATLFGPLYLGYGQAEEGHTSLYLLLGNQF